MTTNIKHTKIDVDIDVDVDDDTVNLIEDVVGDDGDGDDDNNSNNMMYEYEKKKIEHGSNRKDNNGYVIRKKQKKSLCVCIVSVIVAGVIAAAAVISYISSSTSDDVGAGAVLGTTITKDLLRVRGSVQPHTQQQQLVVRQRPSLNHKLKLPDYLEALDENDDVYDEHRSQLTSKWIMGNPGEGNMIPDLVELVRFVKPHYVFRIYGSGGDNDNKAMQCGYWWVTEPPQGDIYTFIDHFAICPEWNDATNIVRCRVPTGYIAIVGLGQSVECPDSHLNLNPNPDLNPSNLQLNGDICNVAIVMEKHLACEYCSSNTFHMEQSSCSNNGSNYIDGFTFGH